jgi:hypothetical protein
VLINSEIRGNKKGLARAFLLSTVAGEWGLDVGTRGLALSIEANWVGSTRRRRQNPVSETLCVLNRNRTMDNVLKHNICPGCPHLPAQAAPTPRASANSPESCLSAGVERLEGWDSWDQKLHATDRWPVFSVYRRVVRAEFDVSKEPIILVSCLAYSSTVKKRRCFSETSCSLWPLLQPRRPDPYWPALGEPQI